MTLNEQLVCPIDPKCLETGANCGPCLERFGRQIKLADSLSDSRSTKQLRTAYSNSPTGIRLSGKFVGKE